MYQPYVSVNTSITLGLERQSHSKRHTGPEISLLTLHTHSRHRFIGQNCSHDDRADALYFLFFPLSLLSLSIVEFVINTHMMQFHCKPLGLDQKI